MCAFMMPVVKNDWDVYKVDKRSRNNSETSDMLGALPLGGGMGGGGGRRSRQGQSGGRRRLSEGGRSHSYHVAPSSHHDLQYVNAHNRAYHSHANSRNHSEASLGKYAGDLASPAKSSQSLKKKSNGPTKSQSSNSLNKFHTKVMDKLKSALNLRDQNSESTKNEDPEDTRSQS
ncbi:unnamed protein product [Meganyctiphanes norvegica]|uniref:Uncharacterized protein n=1 Tax=Meganyctiphanes norvegica TaxID=48144 RepID=A0AAV2RG24_MEGNR